jgi:hypothetical protein
MEVALQGTMITCEAALMLPRAQLGDLMDEATALLVVMQIKAMGRSRGEQQLFAGAAKALSVFPLPRLRFPHACSFACLLRCLCGLINCGRLQQRRGRLGHLGRHAGAVRRSFSCAHTHTHTHLKQNT